MKPLLKRLDKLVEMDAKISTPKRGLNGFYDDIKNAPHFMDEFYKVDKVKHEATH